MTRMVLHGGDLADLLASHPGAPHPLIDLSTGINPWPYPARPGETAWTKLPQRSAEDACRAAWTAALGAAPGTLTLTPGTQIAISLLPLLLPGSRVSIAAPTYGEHKPAWQAQGHEVSETARETLCEADADTLIITNPNNPDGTVAPPATLLALAEKQAARGGFLIVDEAFADVMPAISLAPHAGRDGLVILRSFGKFFGLAGARLGAVLAPAALRERIETALGPWAVSGPALALGTAAFQDAVWIDATRKKLQAQAASLDRALSEAGMKIVGGTSLYRLAAHENAREIHTRLAKAGIHARHFSYEKTWLRFGLPPDEEARKRLSAAL